MLSSSTSKWLQSYYAREDAESIEGDGPATTLNMCGAVIIAAVLDGTTSPDRLSDITGLPVAFCAVAISNLDYNHLWESESFLDLCRTLRVNIDDEQEIDESLSNLLEDYWVRSKLPGIHQILPALRGTYLLFGRRQTWIDDERLDELLGAPSCPIICVGKEPSGTAILNFR